ncbi:MAG: hypothetical protein J0L92_03425 [Deltaproteobacteria bacterium]|nr:hypothetical protein [Deltaproteobacteria bacterium]
MAKQKRRALTAAGISFETLEQTPMRATAFLFGLVAEPRARGILVPKGYDDAEHNRGFRLLEGVANSRTENRVTDLEVNSAIAELDNWDEPNIRLLRASLRRFPEVSAHVMTGIEPIAGPGAVLNVDTILKRVDTVGGVKNASAALAVLAKRGFDEAERKRLAALVKIAKTGGEVPDTKTSDDAYEQALLALREWYDEWSEIARLTIKRRDYLIRLGLAERRSSGGEDDLDIVDPTPFLDPTEDPTDPNKPKT